MHDKGRALILVLALLLSAHALAAPPAEKRGGMLVDPAGMALYTFDKDGAGTSNCNERCAVLWPPFVAAADARATGEYTLIKRKDGKRQWALRGMPLYYWLADGKPGAATGEAVAGWHLVR